MTNSVSEVTAFDNGVTGSPAFLFKMPNSNVQRQLIFDIPNARIFVYDVDTKKVLCRWNADYIAQ